MHGTDERGQCNVNARPTFLNHINPRHPGLSFLNLIDELKTLDVLQSQVIPGLNAPPVKPDIFNLEGQRRGAKDRGQKVLIHDRRRNNLSAWPVCSVNVPQCAACESGPSRRDVEMEFEVWSIEPDLGDARIAQRVADADGRKMGSYR